MNTRNKIVRVAVRLIIGYLICLSVGLGVYGLMQLTPPNLRIPLFGSLFVLFMWFVTVFDGWNRLSRWQARWMRRKPFGAPGAGDSTEFSAGAAETVSPELTQANRRKLWLLVAVIVAFSVALILALPEWGTVITICFIIAATWGERQRQRADKACRKLEELEAQLHSQQAASAEAR